MPIPPFSEEAMKTRRRARNSLIEPRLQLGLPIVLVSVTAAFVIGQLYQSYLAFGRFYAAIEGTLNSQAHHRLLLAQMNDYLTISAVIAVLYILVVTAIGIGYTHKMVGPMVAFRRQVQALIGGDYSARVKLRKRDAFQGLSDDLNELAECLEGQEKPPVD